MKNKLIVAATIVLFTFFITMIGLGAPDDNPHGDIKQDCQDCHTATSWKHLADPMKFDHDKTGFRLDGSHSQAECMGCHKELVFSHVGTACADCHTDHHLGQFGTNCQNCHTAQDWQSRKDVIELHIQRGFPLTGAHALTDCESCHKNSDKEEFAGTPTACQSCHADAIARAVSPNHIQAGFTSDCENCHRAGFGNWIETIYAHSASFPLTGQHMNAQCNECHANTFAGTSTNCYDCHAPDYDATTAPSHVASGFSTDCVGCHNTNGWIPALLGGFNHQLTAFPLTGAHIATACIACHATQYAGTPTDCYACHRLDYEAAANPVHSAAGFSTDCATCHTPASWNSTTWNHDVLYFPIYSGKHLNQWNQCSECHTVSNNFTLFDCTNCHSNNHPIVNNYQYLSTACYNCHPNGRR